MSVFDASACFSRNQIHSEYRERDCYTGASMYVMKRYFSSLALSVAFFIVPGVTQAQTSCAIAGDLSFGATGGEVTKLQTFLKAQGYFSAAMIPNFGNATLAAVRSFQRANGISQTGTVGPMTRAAIATACASGGGATTASIGSSNTFEVTGWLPYWRASSSTKDVIPHLDEVTEVNPFVYTLTSDGTIVDNGKMNEEPWVSFVAAAKEKKVRVVPTIMTSNGAALHALLSSQSSRIALEDRIAALVKSNGWDGIDLDFEGKKAETKNYFSTFLKGLYQRMGNKWVMCTIESRTPISSRYYGGDVPPDAEIYANDFAAINKYCDRVRIMAYDQQGIDQELAAKAASSSQLYAPVADPFWVEKVVNVAKKSIKPSKILIGVPTYGYEYDVTAYANNEFSYDILWTFNQGYAWQIANQYGITPMRNQAGEMYFTYTPTTASASAPVTSLGPNSAVIAFAAAASYADTFNSHQTFRLIDWPDAQSIAGKADLAERLGVRGISIFKFDGGEDPLMWADLVGVKK